MRDQHLLTRAQVRNHAGLTPLVLAAQLGKSDMFSHITSRRRRTFYSLGPVSGAQRSVGGMRTRCTRHASRMHLATAPPDARHPHTHTPPPAPPPPPHTHTLAYTHTHTLAYTHTRTQRVHRSPRTACPCTRLTRCRAQRCGAPLLPPAATAATAATCPMRSRWRCASSTSTCCRCAGGGSSASAGAHTPQCTCATRCAASGSALRAVVRARARGRRQQHELRQPRAAAGFFVPDASRRRQPAAARGWRSSCCWQRPQARTAARIAASQTATAATLLCLTACKHARLVCTYVHALHTTAAAALCIIIIIIIIIIIMIIITRAPPSPPPPPHTAGAAAVHAAAAQVGRVCARAVPGALPVLPGAAGLTDAAHLAHQRPAGVEQVCGVGGWVGVWACGWVGV
jgi:hypothetical protein